MTLSSVSLDSFLTTHPSIRRLRPSDPQFDETTACFTVLKNDPSLILRPQSSKDVADIVSHCAATKVPFTVRVGGHDLANRSTALECVQIDMRDIAHVRVSDDKKTARIGGGILSFALLQTLATQGLFTPVGAASSVGYIGWATLAGHGPYMPSLGLGREQIVGASIVNAQGEVVLADDATIAGLRSSAGLMGIVVEATIRVYPIPEIWIVEGPDIDFLTNYSSLVAASLLPNNLHIHFDVISGASNSLILAFIWTGASIEEASAWWGKLSNLGLCVSSTVAPTTPVEYIKDVSSRLPEISLYHGKVAGVALAGQALSQTAIEIFANRATSMPAPGTMASLHVIHGKAVDDPVSQRLVPEAESQVLLEIIGHSLDELLTGTAWMWTEDFFEQMKQDKSATDCIFLAFIPPEQLDLAKLYRGNLSETKRLKTKLDPDNVFSHGVPQL